MRLRLPGVAIPSYMAFGRRPVLKTDARMDTALVQQRLSIMRGTCCHQTRERDSIMLKRLMLVLVAVTLGSSILLTGCNTMQGAGRDISKAGDKIQDEAAEHKHY